MKNSGAYSKFHGSCLTLGIVATFAGCASVPVQGPFVAATSQTVLSSTHPRLSEVAHVIFVENRSSEPVRVTATRLDDCQNVREQCEMTPAQIEVPPGGKKQVMVVHPRRDVDRYSYRFGFLWTRVRGRDDITTRR